MNPDKAERGNRTFGASLQCFTNSSLRAYSDQIWSLYLVVGDGHSGQARLSSTQWSDPSQSEAQSDTDLPESN